MKDLNQMKSVHSKSQSKRSVLQRHLNYLSIFLDFLCWFTFTLYLTGGFTIGDQQFGSYIKDILSIDAVLCFVFFLVGLNLKELSFVKAFQELNDAILNKQLPSTFKGRFISLACLYLISLFILAPLIRHWSYGTWQWDLGAIEQIIWRGSHGLGFTATMAGNQLLDFLTTAHLSLWLYPLSLIYRILPYTETLLLLQSCALIGCMVPLWKISRRLFGTSVNPILFPIIFWCTQTVHKVNMWDVHENAFISFFILWAFYFFLKKKWVSTILFTLIVGLFKEDAWVIAGALGFYFFSKNKKWALAILCFIAGASIFVGYSALGIKVISVGQRYGYLGNNIHEALYTFLLKPWIVIQHLLTQANLIFYFKIFVIAGGLWIGGGWTLVTMIPTFFEIALSTYEPMRDYNNHYIIPLLGPLFFSAMVALHKIEKWRNPKTKTLLITTAFLLSISQLEFSEPAYAQQTLLSKEWQQRSCYTELLKHIPVDVPLYSSDPFTTHVSRRRVALEMNKIENYDYPGFWAIIPNSETLPPNSVLVKSDCGYKIVRQK